MRLRDVSTQGVDPALLEYVRLFRHALGWRTAITSGVRSDELSHARGNAIDLALRVPGYLELRRSHDPQYHASALLVNRTLEAAKQAKQRFDQLRPNNRYYPIVVLIEYDHWHISHDEPIHGSKLTFGRYLPCQNKAGCDPVQPLRYVALRY